MPKSEKIDTSDALRVCEQMAAIIAPFVAGAEALKAIEGAEQYRNELDNAIADLQDKHAELEDQMKVKRSDIDALARTRQSEMEAIEKDFQDKHSQLHADHAAKSDDLAAELERMKQRKTDLESQIKERETTVNELQTKKNSLITDIDELEEELEAVKKEKAELSAAGNKPTPKKGR